MFIFAGYHERGDGFAAAARAPADPESAPAPGAGGQGARGTLRHLQSEGNYVKQLNPEVSVAVFFRLESKCENDRLRCFDEKLFCLLFIYQDLRNHLNN